MTTIIKVGMAEYKIADRPDVLTTIGLGSCVGIAFYDRFTGKIGLAHIMLPYSKQINTSSNLNSYRFADTCILAMYNEMLKLGVYKRSIVAKISGGAKMFSVACQNDIMKIGERNIDSTRIQLRELSIPIIAEDVGGNRGRTIELFSEDGRVLVKAIGKDPIVI